MSDRNFASARRVRRVTGNSAPSVTVEGMDDLRKMFGQFIPTEARNIMRRTTLEIARIAAVKVRSITPVKTGNLRNSIKADRAKGSKDMIEAKVFADRSGNPKSGRGYHSHLVEFGYVHSKTGQFVMGRPFIVPTVESMRPDVPDLFIKHFGPQFEKELQNRAKRAAKKAAR
jgi:hypothetical protein